MPVYTYRCESCGVQFERHQSFTDAPLRVCPECRKKSLRKVISPVRIVFKGSGFYSTDHRASSASSAPAGKDEKPAAKDEKKKPSKTPAAPSAPKEVASTEKSD
jgi:putative FmdB family regulatory protein